MQTIRCSDWTAGNCDDKQRSFCKLAAVSPPPPQGLLSADSRPSTWACLFTKRPEDEPIALNRLKQIASDVCNSAIGSAEFYDHAKTEQWNSTIINSLLKAVISESTPEGASAPSYKFACNSTIVQHLVPTSALNKARGGTDSKAEEAQVSTSSEATATDGKPHVGRRGMHSATGAYWDEKKDGMWTFKYDGGEAKGLDVVIMLIWVAI
ncbi:hypothetical protein HJFPF1_03800 [Paramyrothecium foliicola]|nr:hypothetical protein HJFPF1_03800 [Paramyrothecium foliicola]